MDTGGTLVSTVPECPIAGSIHFRADMVYFKSAAVLAMEALPLVDHDPSKRRDLPFGYVYVMFFFSAWVGP